MVLLGDVEELWENSVKDVLDCYPETLALEAAFLVGGRYTRLWGNHDLAWSDRELFQKRMAGYGLGDVVPLEAVRLSFTRGNRPADGELFLIHGHQGTADSDRNARISKLGVRFGWRRLQRWLDRPWNTPSVDWALRGEHAADMADWAASRRRTLVAGHTHLPVFYGSKKRLEVTADDVDAGEASAEVDIAQARQQARTAWAEAEERRLQYQQPIDLPTPCYFNTGCCSFGDGDITGIEISSEKIRLVRWPCEPDAAPHELATLNLDELLS